MDPRYHYIYNVSFMQQPVPKEAVFIHFAGSAKPWHRWAQAHPLVQAYMTYKDESLWDDEPIVEATTYKQAKFMARFYKRNKQKGKAVMWYVKYAIWKAMGKR
jgi:lipopolysaccharide biosynthesis glycosyltransferase